MKEVKIDDLIVVKYYAEILTRDQHDRGITENRLVYSQGLVTDVVKSEKEGDFIIIGNGDRIFFKEVVSYKVVL
jgi:hypothetical protein